MKIVCLCRCGGNIRFFCGLGGCGDVRLFDSFRFDGKTFFLNSFDGGR